MRKAIQWFQSGLIGLACLILTVPLVSGYVFPGPREKVEGLGEWSWVFFALSACLFACGIIAIKTRRPKMGGGVAGLSVVLGSFLTIVGLVKIPSSILTISQSSSSSSGIVATRHILNDPIMAPIGIGLLILAAALIVISRRWKKSALHPPPPPPAN